MAPRVSAQQWRGVQRTHKGCQDMSKDAPKGSMRQQNDSGLLQESLFFFYMTDARRLTDRCHGTCPFDGRVLFLACRRCIGWTDRLHQQLIA